jgi:hypothetical protein
MRLYIYFISFFFSVTLQVQSTRIEKLNKGTIPYVKVSELNRVAEKTILFFRCQRT